MSNYVSSRETRSGDGGEIAGDGDISAGGWRVLVPLANQDALFTWL